MLILLLALSGCAKVERPSSLIVFGAPWEPIAFHPQRGLDSASYYAQTLVYEGLIGYDKELNFAPALAESFSVSADGRKYQFKLRPNLRFSNGEKLSVRDVIATLAVAQAKGSPYRTDFADIEKTAVLNDETLVLYLSQPCAPLLSRLVELRVLPDSILNASDKGVSTLARKPIGTGPFCLESWRPGLELVFRRNKFYWGNDEGKGARTETLVWRIVPDKYLMALALKNKELDVAQVDASSWQYFLRKANLQLATFPGSRTAYLAFNLQRPPFDLVSVRRAVSMAINKEELITGLYEGFAGTATSDFLRSGWAYDKDAKTWPYDPKESMTLLKKAGISTLAFSILTVIEYQDQALVIADNLRRAGIKTEVHIAEYATMRQRYLKKGEFQTCILSRSVGPDPECILNWGTGGSFNFCRFSDKKVDGLLDKARRSMDRDVRARAYKEIQEILANTQPFVFLLQPELLIAHQKDIKHVDGQKALPWDNPVFNARYWSR